MSDNFLAKSPTPLSYLFGNSLKESESTSNSEPIFLPILREAYPNFVVPNNNISSYQIDQKETNWSVNTLTSDEFSLLSSNCSIQSHLTDGTITSLEGADNNLQTAGSLQCDSQISQEHHAQTTDFTQHFTPKRCLHVEFFSFNSQQQIFCLQDVSANEALSSSHSISTHYNSLSSFQQCTDMPKFFVERGKVVELIISSDKPFQSNEQISFKVFSRQGTLTSPVQGCLNDLNLNLTHSSTTNTPMREAETSIEKLSFVQVVGENLPGVRYSRCVTTKFISLTLSAKVSSSQDIQNSAGINSRRVLLVFPFLNFKCPTTSKKKVIFEISIVNQAQVQLAKTEYQLICCTSPIRDAKRNLLKSQQNEVSIGSKQNISLDKSGHELSLSQSNFKNSNEIIHSRNTTKSNDYKELVSSPEKRKKTEFFRENALNSNTSNNQSENKTISSLSENNKPQYVIMTENFEIWKILDALCKQLTEFHNRTIASGT